ncbi:abscisic acid-responsive [Striga asiatica]|uniref:Abscisic acid-responsive n=1 Tax=Striga asiatica TaxID=4170 RepID=A0A5A7PE22_STRAF|nr:abscisic acid-responsive [Striga asiatica]
MARLRFSSWLIKFAKIPLRFSQWILIRIWVPQTRASISGNASSFGPGLSELSSSALARDLRTSTTDSIIFFVVFSSRICTLSWSPGTIVERVRNLWLSCSRLFLSATIWSYVCGPLPARPVRLLALSARLDGSSGCFSVSGPILAASSSAASVGPTAGP